MNKVNAVLMVNLDRLDLLDPRANQVNKDCKVPWDQLDVKVIEVPLVQQEHLEHR